MVHLIIFLGNYIRNDIICKGSYIYSDSSATNSKAPYSVNVDSSLKILVGI